MSDAMLRHPLHSGHLTVGALKRHKDRPVLFLGDTTLTGGELADRISQYIQAFEALGEKPKAVTCPAIRSMALAGRKRFSIARLSAMVAGSATRP